MKTTLTFLLIIAPLYSVHAQSGLYMPLEFQKAYQAQTRSYDGTPGPRYWRNYTKYFIDVSVQPGSWEVIGQQRAVYLNHSPDTLESIILRTYPNHYKRGGVRDQAISPNNLTDGIQLRNLYIDSVPLTSERIEEHATFLKITLPHQLLPSDSIVLSVDWTMVLPSVYENRIGAYDAHSAFVGYWYPQIGVYDDIDGWDTYEYLGKQEFRACLKILFGFYAKRLIMI